MNRERRREGAESERDVGRRPPGRGPSWRACASVAWASHCLLASAAGADVPGEHRTQQAGHVGKQARHVETPAPHLEKQAPHLEKQAPHSEKQAPHLEKQAPHSEAPARRVEGPARHLEKLAPCLERPALHVERPARHVEWPAGHVEKQASHLETPGRHVAARRAHGCSGLMQPDRHRARVSPRRGRARRRYPRVPGRCAALARRPRDVPALLAARRGGVSPSPGRGPATRTPRPGSRTR